MNKTRVAVKAVIVCNGCFLLLERRQNGEEGIYDLPGGGVETGESHTQALTREIFEETGLTVRIKRPLRTWSFSPRAGETLYGVTFLAEYLSGTVRLSAEHGSWQWFPFSRTADAGLPRWIRDESALAAEAVERERDAFSVTRIHRGIYGVIRREGKILLIRKKRGPYTGLFDLPGGSPEKGESEERTLARELEEEPGCRLQSVGERREENVFFRGFIEDDGRPGGLFHTGVLFDCTVDGVPDRDISDLDSDGASWIDEKEPTTQNAAPMVLAALRR